MGDLSIRLSPERDAAQFVHDTLRRDIVSGVLEPGSPLSQVKLAARLGVSRTPLREALRLLEREGLVVSEHNKRVRVAAHSLDELEQIYAMRISLEALGLRISMPALGASDLAMLDDQLEAMRQHAERSDYEAWEAPHRAFHRALLRHSGETVLRSIDALAAHAERYRYAYATQLSSAFEVGHAEHVAILAAVRRGDVEVATAALGRHYARVAHVAIAMAAPEHDPFPVRAALAQLGGGAHRARGGAEHPATG